VSAEIFQFPNQERQIRLSVGLASLDEVVAEIERLMTGAEPDADLHHLLDVIQRFSERVTELGHLLLGSEAKLRLGTAFDALSATIIKTKLALDELDRRASS
jgi:hypothetical protein